MRVTQSWDDNWNDVIRYAIFVDAELKSLMCIPDAAQNDLRKFVSKYFIEDAMSDILMEDQDVIITYYGEKGVNGDMSNVTKKYMTFDVYCKRERLNDCDSDRMRMRTKRIAQKLTEILTDKKYIHGLSFKYVDDYNLGTKTIGYVRHHVVFSYYVTH